MRATQRLHILSKEDVAALYEPPIFTDIERRHFFTLPENLLTTLNIHDRNNRRTPGIAYFILQYGYFKAKHQFFNVRFRDIALDLAFVARHFLPNDAIPNKLPSSALQKKTKKIILAYSDFQDDTVRTKQKLLSKLEELTRRTQNPLEIFEEIIKHLHDERCVLPPYTILQDLIGAAFKTEDARLSKQVQRKMPETIKIALNNLLTKIDQNYLITFLQFDAKTFQTGEMQKELDKLEFCRPIYNFAMKFLPSLELSQSMIHYYADLVPLYKADRLKKAILEITYLSMMCYIISRYERINNNLAQAFIYHVDKYHSDGKIHAEKNLSAEPETLTHDDKQIGKLLEVFTDKKIMTQAGSEIEAHAFEIMPKEKIKLVSQKLMGKNKTHFDREQSLIWEYHAIHHHGVRINLRPIFKAIDFNEIAALPDLFKAYQFWKRLLANKKSITDYPLSRIPMSHIHPKTLQKKFIKKKGNKKDKRKKYTIINKHQYEFYLYRALRENIRQRKISINSSVDYKSFEAEINKPKDWDKAKTDRLIKLNNKVLLKPVDTILHDLEIMLEAAIEKTNRRALNGENKNIKITQHRDGRISWTLPYPKKNSEIDNPFYNKLEIKTISEIFDFVEKECHFMRAFSHIKPRSGSNKFDYIAVKGVILANGTLQGSHLFAKRSNLKYKRLRLAEENHIRLHTLRAAADIIIDKMINLPIFELYLISNNLHGSVDGTKKKLRRRLLKARYSSKYFGTDVGMVLMTMGLGHIPFATKVIGANEHESHFVFPMMIQNNNIINPDIISTDTAGTNNINDLLYYVDGKTHAPCYRTIFKKAKNICGFKPLSQYKGLLIKPNAQLNKKLILDKWPEILPVLYSLFSHDSKQEKIIQQLSSHDYKSDIKEAIWELNRILSSIHILKYIDEPQYQRDIRTALNRGEAYHQLLKTIGEVGGGDFRGMSDIEVEIWNECMRLIALIIIYYNMSLLSKLLKINQANGNKEATAYLASISPVASQHLNLSGLYEFSEDRAEIDVESVVAKMEEILQAALENDDE